MEKVFLKTLDNKTIAANFYETETPRFWAIFIHMMPEIKESFHKLAEYFNSIDCAGLAIDLRGHGESEKGPYGYREFSDLEHQLSINDLESAVQFLVSKSAELEKIYFIGASIGANLSLKFISENPDFRKTVLLSAGLDYRGIKTEDSVKKLRFNQKIFFISSEDDYLNADENKKLFDLSSHKENHLLKIFEKGGHGTDIIENNPEIIEEIANFLFSN